jgi:hypothetical protein
MKTRIARFGALAVFALGIAAFTGTAIAGNGTGNGNAGTPPGQDKNAAAAQPAAPPSASPSHHGKTSRGQAAKASTPSAGVKPSSSTSKSGHWTTCSTGGGTGTSATCTSKTSSKPDASKRYGNGKTAAQIANGRGAPSGTILTGPGNSQPHKVAVCPHKSNKSGGVDVHAVKSYSTATCAKQHSASQVTQMLGGKVPGTTAAPSGGTAGASATAAAAQRAAGGVLGAQATLVKPAKAKAAGGVLGAVTRLGVAGAHATLPFTGLQLWVAVLIALGLIAGGFAVRAGRATTH